MKNYVTCSLLDSFQYLLSKKDSPVYEDKFKEFIDRLSKKPIPPNMYMKGGLRFEDEVETLSKVEFDIFNIEAEKYSPLVRKCAEILKGAEFQVNLNKDFKYSHPAFEGETTLKIAGRWDAMKNGIIYDMKKCFYECFSGDYADNCQHLFYLYCTPYNKFIYLLCYENPAINYAVINQEIHLKSTDLEDQIKAKLDIFFDFLVENKKVDIFKEKWVWRGD